MEFKGKAMFESARDKSFIKSLKEFIESEKEQLSCPDEGPDEQRYTIYSTAFHKIIDYSTAYKLILTTIKKEYDDFITSLKKEQHEAQLAHGKLKAHLTQPTSLMYYQRRAAQLQERIATIQRNTSELQTDITRLQGSQNNQQDLPQLEKSEVTVHIGQTPGLTLSESLNPECLDKHLEFLEQKRNALLIKRRREYVPVRLKIELDRKMKLILGQRDELSAENTKLLLWNKQLTYLKEALGRWENSGCGTTLPELLSSALMHVARMTELEDDQTGQTNGTETDDPGEIKESMQLTFYIERFIELFESADYETAAFHASMSPHGVLRNIRVMEKFRDITVHQGAIPPLLIFFRSLMISAQPDKPLPERMSNEGVRYALHHGHIELVMLGVSQRRLTFTEELGDLICSYADGGPRTVDTCLTLAQIVYSGCGMLGKAALCMCRRGQIGTALQFIYNHKAFTIEDVVFVLKELPSVELLQDLTAPCDGVPALMSVGFIVHYLLHSKLEDLGFQLLEQIRASGLGPFEKTILDDEMCSAESWGEIASRFEQTGRLGLSRDITSALLLHDGAVRLSPSLDGARLMEHVFL